ncbi:hypothetical protein [Marivita hallyeonensis]|uniref:hypothetical protein n=1 Tax=Marivita hallyeonensis TaxID=996342 RepID=UPI0011601D28|nr:hypothetical protein [Marivita hallyeonensis]
MLNDSHIGLENMLQNSWLSDVIVLNESSNFDQPGDVDIFRNAEEMCDYLEHWFVEENLGFALSGLGLLVELRTDGRKVFATIADEKPAKPETLRQWLVAAASSIHDVRKHKASQKGWHPFRSPTHLGLAERNGVLPQSIEGLIAYISMK